MSTKKLIVLTICCLQAACTTPSRMNVNEISAYKIDCDKREEQFQFLESQKYSANERFNSGLQYTSVGGLLSNLFHGTLEDTRDALNSRHEGYINLKQDQLKQYCARKDSIRDNEANGRRIAEQRRQQAIEESEERARQFAKRKE